MPELPEVEAIRQIIEPQIQGRSIEQVAIGRPEVIAHPAAAAFCPRVTGQAFTGVGRWGKFLIFQLESGDRLLLHLRMTGQLRISPAGAPVEKHTHLAFHLSNGRELRYIDARRFGRFWLLRQGEAAPALEALGLEPLDPCLTAAYLQQRLGARGKPVKAALLDQSVVAGIGNIYADEILFAAGIHPGARCSALTAEDWQVLSRCIPAVIRWGIEADQAPGYDPSRDYRSIAGLKAYGRTGQPCVQCGAPLERLTLGGRSSVFCPRCQRLRP